MPFKFPFDTVREDWDEVVFEPLPDITAFELAGILKHFAGVVTTGAEHVYWPKEHIWNKFNSAMIAHMKMVKRHFRWKNQK